MTRAVVVQQAESLADRLDARLVEHTVHDFEVCPIVKLLTVLPEPRPRTPEQERHYLSRLAAIPEFLAKSAVRHRGGLAAGRLPIADRVRSAIDYLDRYLAHPTGDPLRKVPVRNVAERDRLVDDVVRPAFATYRQVLAARHADVWITYGDSAYRDTTPAGTERAVRSQAARLEDECAAVGRDPGELQRLYLIGNTDERPLASVHAFVDFAGRYRELGFTDLVFHHPRPDDPVWHEPGEIVEKIATDAFPAIR